MHLTGSQKHNICIHKNCFFPQGYNSDHKFSFGGASRTKTIVLEVRAVAELGGAPTFGGISKLLFQNSITYFLVNQSLI